MRALLLVAALLALPTALAQEHALPRWAEGDAWSYATSFRGLPGNLTVTVERASETEYSLLGVVDEMTPFGVPIQQRHHTSVVPDTLARARFGYEGGAEWRIEPPCHENRFPLRVGANWTTECAFTLVATNETTWFNSTWRVAARENVTVPAGTFDAYLVEQTLDGTVVKRWWAPEACHYVKLLQEGDAVRTEELTSYRCAANAPAQPSPSTPTPATSPSTTPGGTPGPTTAPTPAPGLAVVTAALVAALWLARRR